MFHFALVVLSFFMPTLVAVGLYAYRDRLPYFVMLIITALTIVFISLVQFSWAMQNGTEFLGSGWLISP